MLELGSQKINKSRSERGGGQEVFIPFPSHSMHIFLQPCPWALMKGHFLGPTLCTTPILVAAESPSSSGVLPTTPTPSGRKILQTAVYCRCQMCARISGYSGAHNLAPSPENCVDFGRLKQKQEIVLSPSFRVIPNNTTASYHRAGGSPTGVFQSWLGLLDPCLSAMVLFYFLG